MIKNKLLVILGVIFLFVASSAVFANEKSSVCGDTFCDLNMGESYQNCPQDCLKEENPEEIHSLKEQKDKCYVKDKEVDCARDDRGPDSRVLPESLLNFFGDENNDLMFIAPFLIAIIVFLYLLLSQTKIAGKTLKEYIFPIKYYIIGSVLIVISQYVVALPLSSQYPFLINLTQGLWALMVALSAVKLAKERDFNMKNILFLGVLYSFIIHGTKVSIRYFFYGMPTWYYVDRFLYGSFLVMGIVIIIGPLFLYLKKKDEK